MEAAKREGRQGGFKVLKVLFSVWENRTSHWSDSFSHFILEKRLISGVGCDLDVHEGVTEQ